MKAFVSPIPGTLASTSHSMLRVARALERYAPKEVEIVDSPVEAELQVLHVIGADSIRELVAPKYAAIQYCWKTAGEADWLLFWHGARSVWSYYRLPTPVLYHAPLGVDASLFTYSSASRQTGVVTSGYVNGPRAEAIEEMAEAADRLGLSVFHLGPKEVAGMARRREHSWRSGQGISDIELVSEYQQARFVSGLRHVEGFELPVLEGFACGARPIVFDRPETRQWFHGFANFVPECSGEELSSHLYRVLRQHSTVSQEARDSVMSRFSWSRLVGEFWKEVLK